MTSGSGRGLSTLQSPAGLSHVLPGLGTRIPARGVEAHAGLSSDPSCFYLH